MEAVVERSAALDVHVTGCVRVPMGLAVRLLDGNQSGDAVLGLGVSCSERRHQPAGIRD